MDTIGDFLTVLRNASRAKKAECEVQFSKVRFGIAKILQDQGYINDASERLDENGFKRLVVRLKYVKAIPVLSELKRCSTPGARWYVSKDSMPKVLNGLGMCIVSTSRGLMCGHKAKSLGVGGELICKVW